MRISTATSAVVRVLRRRPGDILPFYLLGIAVPAIARAGMALIIVFLYVYLALTSRLEAAIAAFSTVDTEPPDPESDPEAFAEWSESLEPVFSALFDPVVVIGLVLATVVFVVGTIVLYAVVTAGQLAACDARLRDQRGLVAGIAGARRYWLPFLGLFVLEFLLWVGAFAVVAIGLGVIGALFVFATGLEVLAFLFVPLGALLFLLCGVLIRAVFAFAPVAVVVEDVGVTDSLSHSVGFIRRRPVGAAFYYIIAVGAIFLYSTLSSLLFFLGVSLLLTIVFVLVLLPGLDLLKTALYALDQDRLEPPSAVERSVRTQLTAGLLRGWRDLFAFVRETPGLHTLSTAAIVIGTVMGWILADPLVGVVDTSIAARLEGHNPVTATFQFFGNNWLVALLTAFSGVALGIPALFSLWFNGINLGVVSRLEVELIELIAFVIPHGILEIPAIIISGAVGCYLGLVWWRTVRGLADREAFAAGLERSFWVLIGVGILLAVAAAIEGFVSPYYFQLFL